MVKHLRHQDTKTQRLILTKGFALCLGAFVAIYSGLSGLGIIKSNYLSRSLKLTSTMFLDCFIVFNRISRKSKAATFIFW